MKIYIYSISHPTTLVPFYIGKTNNLENRKKQHLFSSHNTCVSNKIDEIKNVGLDPLFSVILEVDKENSSSEEIRIISEHISKGINLCNAPKIISEKQSYTINSTPDLIGRVDRIAKLNKRSRSAEVEVAIEKHLRPNEETMFTEKDIINLQMEVHKITGDGDVMVCFNRLLGVAVGG